MDFTNELLKARLHYAETPSDDARFAFVYYLLKSKNKLDLNNATFHLVICDVSLIFVCARSDLTLVVHATQLELLSKDPLNKNYLYHLALAHFKLGDYQKCKKVLEQFAALSSDSTTTKSAIERNAAVLMRECENERRKELLVESAVIGASLSLGLLGVVVGGAIVASKFLTKK